MKKIEIILPGVNTPVEKNMLVALIGNIMYPLDAKCTEDGKQLIIVPLENDSFQLGIERDKKLSFYGNNMLITDRYSTITEDQKTLLSRTFLEIYGEKNININYVE